jgi:KDO2-lipid IV(A) lauroyltransferase
MLSRDTPASVYFFLADQCPRIVNGENRCTFLHQETGMYRGIEKLARKTDSAVLYFHITHSKRGHYFIECIPVCESARLESEEIIPRYIRLLENNIKEIPHGWLWTHRRWKR